MIRLTSKNGETVFLSPEHIVKIESSGNSENSAYVDGTYVTESPEEVARKVLEYKLAMDDHANAPNPYRNEAYKNLFKLAGLEVEHG